MKKYILLLALISNLLILSGCNSQKQEIVISAASSLQNALEEIEINYEKEHEDVDLQFNFGGSGTLVTQILEGAPVDICFLASSKNYETLEEENKIIKGVPLLGNSLVLITNKENPVTKLEEANTIAMGTPEVVPAGDYAKEALKAEGLWEDIQDKIVLTKDVEEVKTYVSTGNVDMGFVYQTDVMDSNNIQVVEEIDQSLYDEIVYPLGLLTKSQEAQEFYNYLQTDEAIQVFEKYGFIKNNE